MKLKNTSRPRFGAPLSRRTTHAVLRLGVTSAISVIAMHAHAQSNVTLYGIADAGLTYTNNSGGASAVQVGSGGRGSSRWGFKGQEDLGGGTAAIFQLENGFNLATGTSLQNSREFGRLAFVGLKNRYGSLTVGRQDDVMVTYVGGYGASVLFGGSLASRAGDLDNGFADYKLDNTIRLTSESFGGFSFGALYAVGGVAGAAGRNQTWGLGARYAYGALSLGAAYRRVNNPAVTYFDAAAGAVANTTFANPVSNPIFRGYTSATSLETYALGGSYLWGRSTFAASVTRSQFNDVKKTSTTPLGGINPVLTSAELVYKFMLTPNVSLASSYAYTKADTARYQQVSLGAQYFLSKRTGLYAIGAWQHAAGTNSLGQKAVANLNLLSASSTANQTALKIGISHSF
ncbi:porin [Pandoraea sp. NPDC087047]|uniref:porin n=1 Tax=Pandoraea sp. NPDC087047 TaxID=3364390 RepID=UPI003826E054